MPINGSIIHDVNKPERYFVNQRTIGSATTQDKRRVYEIILVNTNGKYTEHLEIHTHTHTSNFIKNSV